jgi:hypothetical protein
MPTKTIPPAPKSKGTTPRQFRFTAEEIARIDAVALTLAMPGVPVTRTTVLRLAFAMLEARQMEGRKKA